MQQSILRVATAVVTLVMILPLLLLVGIMAKRTQGFEGGSLWWIAAIWILFLLALAGMFGLIRSIFNRYDKVTKISLGLGLLAYGVVYTYLSAVQL
ncbi:MAG TPA: hypothetical protein VMH83_05105, partial [Candidatus Acidoferrum sp.]|nr:hypothetical protein [Candidatus Acidoferrum sp.]